MRKPITKEEVSELQFEIWNKIIRGDEGDDLDTEKDVEFDNIFVNNGYTDYDDDTSYRDFIETLSQSQLNKLYADILKFQQKYNIQIDSNSIEEIKMVGKITPEMIEKIWVEIFELEQQVSVVKIGRWDILDKYTKGKYKTNDPFYESIRKLSKQNKLSQLYSDLLNLKQQYGR